MAKRVTITNQGAALLASSSQATGQYYWLGYYALAYVPNLWKESTVTLPTSPDDCDAVNEGTPILSTDTDQVTATMTRLTKYGDMIYNIWQGDLNGTGFYGCQSDGSAGGDLFGLTMYNTNIKKHYRYVLDENGNNTLVAWVDDGNDSLEGKHVYKGTDGYVPSNLPIPAPLYYLGDVTGKSSVDSFFDEFPTFEEETGPTGNGSDIYPFFADQALKDTVTNIDVPKVSADYRGYLDSQGNDATYSYTAGATDPTVGTAGQYFDTMEIPDAIDVGFDVTSWYAADLTYTVDDYSVSGYGFSPAIKEFWKLLSISNYNRFHSPVSSIGHVLSSDLSNRNMAKTTKFFPISNYKVVNTDSGFTANNESVEIATSIKLSIDIDLAPRALAQGFDENCDYDETNNIEFFDRYDIIQPSTLGDGSATPNDNLTGSNIFNTTHVSFKFNRIGIYAVPLRKAPYVQDNGFGTDPTGQNVELEFQISPDEEPVLFAVIDWDNTVSMSDTGDGIHEFKAEFNVNLESPDGIEDSALLRDATIFYNLYEDDAITWYQNQLIANASTQNAITELGLEVANIKNRSIGDDCCPPPDLSGLYAPLNHSHSGIGLRNLLDANNSTNGGLKGIDTSPEGSTIEGEVYELGLHSIALGESTSTAGYNSNVLGGTQNIIKSTVFRGSVVGGAGNRIFGFASDVVIAGGVGNLIDASIESGVGSGATTTIIGGGVGNEILGAYHSGILSGADNTIKSVLPSSAHSSCIGAGLDNLIDSSRASGILAGNTNIISDAEGSSIISGYGNSIYNNYVMIGAGELNESRGDRSAIVSGYDNYIDVNAVDSFIGAGSTNEVESAYSAIVAGESNYIIDTATHSSIVGGYDNLIESGAIQSSILGGNSNYIGININQGVISGGAENTIDGASNYASISGGKLNSILVSSSSIISGGHTNDIYRSNYSGILGGSLNYINQSPYSTITGGYSNNIGIGSEYSVISGGRFNAIAAGSDWSVISGGAGNTIEATSLYIFVGSGRDNTISGSYSSIIGGMYGIIDTSDYSSILGGYDNYISDGNYSVINGGRSNYVSVDYASIGGGQTNYIEDGSHAFIPGGYGAAAFHTGEFAHGNNIFSNGIVGGCQRSVVLSSCENPSPTSSAAGSYIAVNGNPLGSASPTGLEFITIDPGESIVGTITIQSSSAYSTSCASTGEDIIGVYPSYVVFTFAYSAPLGGTYATLYDNRINILADGGLSPYARINGDLLGSLTAEQLIAANGDGKYPLYLSIDALASTKTIASIEYLKIKH